MYIAQQWPHTVECCVLTCTGMCYFMTCRMSGVEVRPEMALNMAFILTYKSCLLQCLLFLFSFQTKICGISDVCFLSIDIFVKLNPIISNWMLFWDLWRGRIKITLLISLTKLSEIIFCLWNNLSILCFFNYKYYHCWAISVLCALILCKLLVERGRVSQWRLSQHLP